MQEIDCSIWDEFAVCIVFYFMLIGEIQLADFGLARIFAIPDPQFTPTVWFSGVFRDFHLFVGGGRSSAHETRINRTWHLLFCAGLLSLV